MHSATLMERLLRLFVGKDRAEAMIGDLLEIEPNVGRFCIASLALFARASWKPCAALVLAYGSVCVTWIPAFSGWGYLAGHMRTRTGGVVAWGFLFCCAAQLECISAVFALVLYGFRNALTVVCSVLVACRSEFVTTYAAGRV
jgi:hypothetical protein